MKIIVFGATGGVGRHVQNYKSKMTIFMSYAVTRQMQRKYLLQLQVMMPLFLVSAQIRWSRSLHN